jgi:hypothetical protein
MYQWGCLKAALEFLHSAALYNAYMRSLFNCRYWLKELLKTSYFVFDKLIAAKNSLPHFFIDFCF